MRNCFIMIITLLLISPLAAQDAGTGEGPGQRDRLVDFNALGNIDPAQDFLATDNWLVNLNSSANYRKNSRLTYVKNADSAAQDKKFIGVRINFPNFPNNAYATLNPPLGFPFYGEVASGILTNVGTIKSVITRVAGRNYPYSVFLNLQHSSGDRLHAPLGRIEFLGWRDLQYDNPEYIEELKQRTFILRPAYPRLLPSVRMNDITFFRNGETHLSGDFISYVAWVDIIYDKAFSETELQELKESEDYVDDDAVWEIQSGEYYRAENALYQNKIERHRYLEKLERDKMNLPPRSEATTPPPPTQQQPPQ